MRHLRFGVILFCCFTTFVAYGQTITYKVQDETTATILQGICDKTGYQLSYNSDIFSDKKQSYNFVNKDINTCLSEILGNTYTYKIIGKQIIITEATKEKKDAVLTKKKLEPQTKIVTIYDTIPIYDTITQYRTITDTIVITDTVPYVDTITMKRYETNYLHTTKKCLSASASIGIAINSIQFSDKSTYASLLQEIHKKALGFNSQIDVIYKRNKMLFSTGISLSDCRLSNSYQTTHYIDDPQLTYKDTIWYWEYQNIMTYYKFNNGDSVAIQVLDSTYTYTIHENPKKIEYTREKLSTLSWQYVSIPIGVGSHYNITNTFSFEPSVALQTYFLIKSQGEIPSEDLEKTYKVKDILKPINYSFAISCNILYSLEKSYSVSIKPWYSITPSIFKEDKFRSRAFVSHWGLQWGFHYTIPYELF